MSKQIDDPEQARYIRKVRKDQGSDYEQQEQEQEFSKDRTKALNNFSKQATQKDIENQINYFGNIIQPFNLRREQEMGEIDGDGFFIFNKRNRVRDAWLQSIQQAEDQQIAEKLRKRIKTGGRYQTVFQANRQINKDYVEQQQQEENENEQPRDQNQSDQQKLQKQQEGFNTKEIIELLVDMLPQNKSANQYLKELKKQKNQELYDKILELCNQYIEKTSQHDILTKKKEQLEEEIENKEESEQLNWDMENSNEQQKVEKSKVQDSKANQENDDNIW